MLNSVKNNNGFKYTSLSNTKNCEQNNNIYGDVVLEKEQELLYVYSSRIKTLEEQLIEKNNKVLKY